MHTSEANKYPFLSITLDSHRGSDRRSRQMVALNWSSPTYKGHE